MMMGLECGGQAGSQLQSARLFQIVMGITRCIRRLTWMFLGKFSFLSLFVLNWSISRVQVRCILGSTATQV